jgi:hypothetical protein
MAVRGGIKLKNLHASLAAMLLPQQATQALQEALQGQVGTRPGANASNMLQVPANVANGDTITIGDDVFEVDIINTDSAVNTANDDDTGPLNNTDTVSLVTLGAAPATAISAGDVIKIESEMMLVLRKLSTTQYVVYRAYAGTSIATHAKDLDVIVSDSVPTNISVPLVTTLTPAAFGPAFAAVLNWEPPADESAPARTATIGVTANADGHTFTAYSLGAGQEILVAADTAGADTTATTEDFSNSTDNVWANATMVGGVDAGVTGHEVQVRTATAAEELAGRMVFFFPFTVRAAAVRVRTSAGVVKAFTGTVLVGTNETTGEALPDSTVQVRNVGAASTAYAVVFAATDVLEVEAWE